MDTIKEYIKPELIILIPVLYFIGFGLKKSKFIDDRLVPLLLGGIGILLSIIHVGATSYPSGISDFLQMLFVGVTQGILCAGLSVYVNQIIKQNEKGD